MAEKKKTNTNKKSNPAKKKTTNAKKTNQNKAKKTTPKKKNTAAKKTTTTKKVEPKKEVQVEVKPEVVKKPEKEVVIPLVTEAGQKVKTVKEEIQEIIETKDEKTGEKKEAILAKPATILGKELPTGNSQTIKKERLMLYAKDSLIFAVIVSLIDLLCMVTIDSYPPFNITANMNLNCFLTAISTFIFVFIVSFIIEYIFGEKSTK